MKLFSMNMFRSAFVASCLLATPAFGSSYECAIVSGTTYAAAGNFAAGEKLEFWGLVNFSSGASSLGVWDASANIAMAQRTLLTYSGSPALGMQLAAAYAKWACYGYLQGNYGLAKALGSNGVNCEAPPSCWTF